MILSDRTIRHELTRGDLRIDPPPSDSQIQPASIDLRLGWEMKWQNGLRVVLEKDREEGFRLHPRKFILGHTEEMIRIPDYLVGQLNGKSSLGRRGLIVHSTAGYIDPGFQGHITLELYNMGQNVIVLNWHMLIAQLVLISLTTPAERPYGTPGLNSHYQNQTGAQLAR